MQKTPYVSHFVEAVQMWLLLRIKYLIHSYYSSATNSFNVSCAVIACRTDCWTTPHSRSEVCCDSYAKCMLGSSSCMSRRIAFADMRCCMQLLLAGGGASRYFVNITVGAIPNLAAVSKLFGRGITLTALLLQQPRVFASADMGKMRYWLVVYVQTTSFIDMNYIRIGVILSKLPGFMATNQHNSVISCCLSGASAPIRPLRRHGYNPAPAHIRHSPCHILAEKGGPVGSARFSTSEKNNHQSLPFQFPL